MCKNSKIFQPKKNVYTRIRTYVLIFIRRRIGVHSAYNVYHTMPPKAAAKKSGEKTDDPVVQFPPNPQLEKEVKMVFALLDSDGSGSISTKQVCNRHRTNASACNFYLLCVSDCKHGLISYICCAAADGSQHARYTGARQRSQRCPRKIRCEG
jgi:hypothetical protein